MEHATAQHQGPDHERSGVITRVSSSPAGVAPARLGVAQAAQRAGLAADRTADLVVAVSEAVTNAMEAQERAGVTAPIEVRCTITPQVLEVEVHDCGEGFRPEEVRTRPPPEDPAHLDVERGWGIQLMRQLVDELVFDITGTGTTVRLRMALG